MKNLMMKIIVVAGLSLSVLVTKPVLADPPQIDSITKTDIDYYTWRVVCVVSNGGTINWWFNGSQITSITSAQLPYAWWTTAYGPWHLHDVFLQ
jgi:hypothetical protein